MSWLELDDGILDHPKFIRAVKAGGDGAIFLWLGLRAYCAKHLTDGFIPSDMLEEVRGPKEQATRQRAFDALLAVGLLDPAEGGARMHDYLDWSRSRAQILASRQRNGERQAKWRQAPVSNSESAPVSNAISNAVTDSVTNDALSSPLLSTPKIPLSPSEMAPPGGPDIAKSDLESFSPDPPPKKPPKAAAKPGRPAQWRRFPPDFEPDDTHRKIAAELGLNLASQMAEIRDHEFRNPKTDPGATLRTWLRNSVKFGAGTANATGARRFQRPDPRTEMLDMAADHQARGQLEASRQVRELLEFSEKMKAGRNG